MRFNKSASRISFWLSIMSMAVCNLAVQAQVDIRITGPQAGFPIAIPQLCIQGGGQPYDVQLAELMSKDLDLSGTFNVLSPGSFIETPGKCFDPNQVAFSDWSVIGAEGLVKGIITSDGGDSFTIEFYLFDVLRQKMVVGKRYRASGTEVRRVAHKFANEIMLFFTGEMGVFGTRLAYVSKVGRFKELFVMNIDGSDVKRLTEDRGLVVGPSWSPSGDRIVYTSYRTRKPDLYTISPEGGSQQQVTNTLALELGPIYTVDGGGLLASSSASGISNLVLFDLRGKVVRNVTAGGSIDVSPTYSPDGGKIAFCSNRGGGPQIYVMGASGGTESGRRISYTDSPYCTSPTWSPKGDQIAFVCRKGGNQLFVASPDGNNTVQVTFDGNNEDPSFAPDGRYLAFSSTSFGGGRVLAMVSLTTGKIKQLTYTRGEDGQPSWSPRVD